jgi:hypothetical protein
MLRWNLVSSAGRLKKGDTVMYLDQKLDSHELDGKALQARIKNITKASQINDMSLNKLRLIHLLLLAVAKEDGCILEPSEEIDSENILLTQMALTEAAVWSPQADHVAVQSLSDLLLAAQESANA